MTKKPDSESSAPAKATKQDAVDGRDVIAEQLWARGEYIVPVTGTVPADGTVTFTVDVTDLPANQAALSQAMRAP